MVLCRVCIVFVHSLSYVMYSVLNTNGADGANVLNMNCADDANVLNTNCAAGANVLNTNCADGANGKMIETLMLTKGVLKI